MDHDLKWFTKEVRSIIIRNISTDKEVLQAIPSPYIEILSLKETNGSKEDRLIFRGSSVFQSCNPSWTTSAMKSTSNSFADLDTQDLEFRVYDSCPEVEDSGEKSLILQYPMDLRRIVRLGNIQLTSISSLPINSVFLSTDNGLYITENLFGKLMTLGLIPVAGRFNGDDENDINHPGNLRERMNASTERLATLRTTAEAMFGDLENTQRRIEYFFKLAELEKLQEEILLAEADVQSEEELEASERAQYMMARDMSSELTVCEQLSAEIAELNHSCLEQKEELTKIQFLIDCRQLKLLSELQSIYPIEKGEGGEFTIRGLELQLDVNQRDDEQLSSALGYVVHLLLLASKYLEVPLRYQLLYYASRSMIRDPIAIHNTYTPGMTVGGVHAGVALPLYRKGTEKERFDLAVQWLKSDVEQLLLTRGHTYNPRQGLLHNIQQMFACEMCPNLAC